MPGVGWSMYGRGLDGYVYACPLRYRDKWPTTLAVIATENRRHTNRTHLYSTTPIPVEVQVRPSRKEPLAVCVHVAYGHIDPLRLIEWLEFQRILGVSLVGVYLMSNFSPSAERVFR